MTAYTSLSHKNFEFWEYWTNEISSAIEATHDMRFIKIKYTTVLPNDFGLPDITVE